MGVETQSSMKKLALLVTLTVLVIILLLSTTAPKKGHIKLLAVNDLPGEEDQGSIADLYLEIKPGAGRVFIDTLPASKLDTQMSTRLAKNIACELTEKDCTRYDFFYMIRSNSVIVGGPSASAATAILTASVLEGRKLNEKMAITGTLTSGNVIGPVGGLRGKVDIAAQTGIETVLVPFGEGSLNITLKPVNEKAVQSEQKEEQNNTPPQKTVESNATTTKEEKRTQRKEPVKTRSRRLPRLPLGLPQPPSQNKTQNKTQQEQSAPLPVPPAQPLLTTLPTTLPLVEYGKLKGIEVKEVTTIEEALYAFTGRPFTTETLELDEGYTDTMQFVATNLCERSVELQITLNKLLLYGSEKIRINETELFQKQALAHDLAQKGEDAYNEQAYYSSASFCFGANVQYKQLIFLNMNASISDIEGIEHEISGNIVELNNKINGYEIETITDLQAYMIVKDRLIEANEVMLDVKEILAQQSLREKLEHVQQPYAQQPTSIKETAHKTANETANETASAASEQANQEVYREKQQLLNKLAFSAERFQSAIAWSSFFGKKGKTFLIEKEDLKESCQNKLSETEEYYQYLELLAPGLQENTKKQIEKARGFAVQGDYELCLFKASLAKAQMNILASSLITREKDFPRLLEKKLEVVKAVIAHQQAKKIFPVLGYSYYEYAQMLKEEQKNEPDGGDVFSPLLYGEYALELSNLNIYFRTNGLFSKAKLAKFPQEIVLLFLSGLLTGILLYELVVVWKRARKEKTKSENEVKEIKMKQERKEKNKNKPHQSIPKNTLKGKKR